MSLVRIVALSSILAAAFVQAGAANAHTPDVLVVRGGGQSASISEVRESRVQVFRGAPVVNIAALETALSDDSPPIETVSSGSKIWFVDRAAGKLTACRLAKTTQVGEHRIDCYARTLPR